MANQKKRKAGFETPEKTVLSLSMKRELIEENDPASDTNEHANKCYYRAPTRNQYLLACRRIFHLCLNIHTYAAIVVDPSIVRVIHNRKEIKVLKDLPDGKELALLFKEYDPHLRGYRIFHYTALVTYLTHHDDRNFLQSELLSVTSIDYNNTRKAFRILLREIYSESLDSHVGTDIYGRKTTVPDSDTDDDEKDLSAKPPVIYLTPFDSNINKINSDSNDCPTRIYRAHLSLEHRTWTVDPPNEDSWKQDCGIKYIVLPIRPKRISTSSTSSQQAKPRMKTRSAKQTTCTFTRVNDLVNQYQLGKTSANTYKYFTKILSFADIQLLCNIVGKYFHNAQPECLSNTFGKILSDYVIALTQKSPSVDLTTEEEIPSDQTVLPSDDLPLAVQITNFADHIDESIQKMTDLVNNYEAEIGGPIDISMIDLADRSMRTIYHWMNSTEQAILKSGRSEYVYKSEPCQTPVKKTKKITSTPSSSKTVGNKTPGDISSAVNTKTLADTSNSNSNKPTVRKKAKTAKTAEADDSTVKDTQPDPSNK